MFRATLSRLVGFKIEATANVVYSGLGKTDEIFYKLENVVGKHGSVLADHLWVAQSQIMCGQLKKGLVSFRGIPYKYKQIDGIGYGIEDIEICG